MIFNITKCLKLILKYVAIMDIYILTLLPTFLRSFGKIASLVVHSK